MTTRSVRLALCALAVASMACQPPAQEAASLSDEDVAAIKDLAENVVVEALLAEDWAAFAAGFTEDAVRMVPNEPLHQGRQTIEQWARTSWGPMTMLEGSQTVLEVDGRGDLAYATITYSFTAEVPGLPEPVMDVGKGLVILRKQPDGAWLVSVSIYNADTPPPPPPTE
ncbi:MAG: DUF4440 domain-containing protein [Gemmatimonadota bacterium]|nr:MAG: DUF4440 domain-containing protein [Gemmatimonadota bacterium]